MGARRRDSRARLDRLLVLLAAAYYVAVAILDVRGWAPASADAVADGRLWLLLTSSLEIEGSVPGLQLLLGASVSAFVIAREGPRLWWAAALTGHVGSALIAYVAIGVAAALDLRSAERASDDPDFGISAILAASLGALAASGAHGRSLADRLALATGLLGLLALVPISLGWYDVEHLLSFALGAGVVWLHARFRARAA